MTVRRIAIVAPHFAEYSERLAAGLAALRPTWVAVNTNNHLAEVACPLAGAARLAIMPMDRRPDQARALLHCLLAIVRFRADLVIVQEGVRQLVKPLVWLLGRFTRVALIVHDPILHSGSDSAQARAHLPVRHWLRRRADVLIVHGEACRRELVAQGLDERRIVAIDHGVLMAPDHPADARPDSRRALMFGRMEAYKGLEVLLGAAERLKARGVALHLVVAGAGPEQARLADRIAALGTVEAIDRYLAPAELERELARAAFVLAPYLDATQSGVLASAFGNGRPVIASDVGGLGDVVEHGVNGLLVPPGDPDALADAMASLLGDSERTERLAEGARRLAATRLAWNDIARRLLDAFDASPPR